MRSGVAERPLRRLTFDPARPAWVARRESAHWYAVAAVCIGAFMGQLDASIVLIAFPTLERDFGATLASVQWVGLSYLLVVSTSVVAVGHAADRLGHKRLYLLGFAAFTVGSALCGLAPSLLALVGLRAVQAIGAAMMQANSVAIIRLAVPADRLGRAMGAQGTAQALGLSLGPLVGGLLIGLGSWRLIFLVNVPIGLAGILAASLFVPRRRSARQPRRAAFDWYGAVFLGGTIATLLLAISLGSARAWSSPETVGLALAAPLLGTAFVIRERRAPVPLLDLALFARPGFSLGISSGMLSYVALFGALFATPFYLEHERGLSPASAGLVLTSLPLALGVVAPFAGLITDRIGPRWPAVAGLAVATSALVLLALRATGIPVVAGELAFLGAGLGAFTPPNNKTIMASAPAEHAGAAGGTLNLTRGIGTAFGLSLAALAFAVSAGSRSTTGSASQGFRTAMLALAAAAGAALVLAALRPRGDAAPKP